MASLVNENNRNQIIILGHRGFKSKYPENTLLSFKEAVKHGADGIELDVWLTKDGKVIVFHDDNLKRLAGISKKIKDMTLNEIKSIRLTQNQKIPTLEEVFQNLPSNTIINVEIKDLDAVEKTIEIINNLNSKDRIMISSFNIQALEKTRELDKTIKLGLLIDNENILPQVPILAKKLSLYSVNIPIDALNIFSFETFKGTLIQFKNLGLKIVLWAEKDELYYENDNLRKLRDIVDIIITDDVERINSALL